MRYRLAAIGFLVLLIGWTQLPHGSSAQITQFNPCARVAVEDSASGASSEVEFTWGIGVGDDCVYEPSTDDKNQYMFDEIIQYIPPDWGVPKDADVPDGTEVGSVEMQATLGLLNNPCQNGLRVNLRLYDATVNISGPTVEPLPPGTANRLKPIGDGTPVAGALEWPTYLSSVFEDADLTKLRARYIGVGKIAAANNLTVIMQMLVFEPGTRLGHDSARDPRRGYPAVVVFQDASAPTSSQDFINDFCSPVLITTNVTHLRNPLTAGTNRFATFFEAEPDADDDGFENTLDTCPFHANIGNPRLTPDTGDAGESPADGIDLVCDPDPITGKGTSGAGIARSDEDSDLWMNRNDNCPLVLNPDQLDSDRDAIGDACDPNRESVDGYAFNRCIESVIAIGDGGVNPDDSCHVGDYFPPGCFAVDEQDQILTSCTPLPTPPGCNDIIQPELSVLPGCTVSPTPSPFPSRTAAVLPRTGGPPSAPPAEWPFAVIAGATAVVAASALYARQRRRLHPLSATGGGS